MWQDGHLDATEMARMGQSIRDSAQSKDIAQLSKQQQAQTQRIRQLEEKLDRVLLALLGPAAAAAAGVGGSSSDITSPAANSSAQ